MTRTFPQPVKPADDPIPWLTDLWRKAGCFDVPVNEALVRLARQVGYGGLEGSVALRQDAATLAAIADTVQSTVAGLHADDSVYRITFDPSVSTAGTTYSEKLVVVGTRPLTADNLTKGQRAAVMSGLALHETGHINDSQPFRAAVIAQWGDPALAGSHQAKAAMAHKVSGIGEDNRIERLQRSRYSGLATSLDVAMYFIAKNQEDAIAQQGMAFPFPIALATPEDRVQALLIAVRYAWHGDWASPEADKALDFLLPWREAMANCATPSEHVKLVEQAMAWIFQAPQQSEQQPPDQNGQGEGEGDSQGESGDDQGQGQGDGDTEGEGNGDQDGDQNGQGQGKGQGQGESQGDSNGKGKDKGYSDKLTEGQTEPSEAGAGTSAVGTGKVPSQKMPKYDESCVADQAQDKQRDRTAETAVQEHHKSVKAVQRTRRYPWHNGSTILVSERVFDKFADLGSYGEQVKAKEAQNVTAEGRAVARTADVRRLGYKPDGKGNAITNKIVVDPSRAAALAAVLNSSKRATGTVERGLRSGRLDRRGLHRVAVADPRVFTQKTAVAPQRVRAYITIDASGSMGEGRKMQQAVQAGIDLAGAIEQIAWAKGKVYAHTSGGVGGMVVPLWESGQPLTNVAAYYDVPQGGTPESVDLAFVCDDLLDDLRSGERGVVIIVSDGQPSLPEHVKAVAEFYRSRGLRVVSVAIDIDLTSEQQHFMYGRDFVPYNSNMAVFSRALAKVIGSTI